MESVKISAGADARQQSENRLSEGVPGDSARARRLAGIQRRLQTRRSKVRERQYSRHLGKVVRVFRRVFAEFFAIDASAKEKSAHEQERGDAWKTLRCCCRGLKDTLEDPELTLW